VAAKALTRPFDVEPSSVKVEMVDGGRLVFAARPGCSLDLERIHASLKETRLSGKPPGRTRAQILYLELTVKGELTTSGDELLLKVGGSKQVFRLEEQPGRKALPPEETDFGRLRKALAQGRKAVTVTGRVKGWSGHFPAVLRELPAEFAPDAGDARKPPVRRPPLLYVVGFEDAPK
jgi:hypothetical protein